jgi:hypothetical protein
MVRSRASQIRPNAPKWLFINFRGADSTDKNAQITRIDVFWVCVVCVFLLERWLYGFKHIEASVTSYTILGP